MLVQCVYLVWWWWWWCEDIRLAFLQFVCSFEQRCSSSANLSLHECEEMLSDVQNRYPFEYKVCMDCCWFVHVGDCVMGINGAIHYNPSGPQMYQLSSLAVAVIFPKVGWSTFVLTAMLSCTVSLLSEPPSLSPSSSSLSSSVFCRTGTCWTTPSDPSPSSGNGESCWRRTRVQAASLTPTSQFVPYPAWLLGTDCDRCWYGAVPQDGSVWQAGVGGVDAKLETGHVLLVP